MIGVPWLDKTLEGVSWWSAFLLMSPFGLFCLGLFGMLAKTKGIELIREMRLFKRLHENESLITKWTVKELVYPSSPEKSHVIQEESNEHSGRADALVCLTLSTGESVEFKICLTDSPYPSYLETL